MPCKHSAGSRPVATKMLQPKTFYSAEWYHQHYNAKNKIRLGLVALVWASNAVPSGTILLATLVTGDGPLLLHVILNSSDVGGGKKGRDKDRRGCLSHCIAVFLFIQWFTQISCAMLHPWLNEFAVMLEQGQCLDWRS